MRNEGGEGGGVRHEARGRWWPGRECHGRDDRAGLAARASWAGLELDSASPWLFARWTDIAGARSSGRLVVVLWSSRRRALAVSSSCSGRLLCVSPASSPAHRLQRPAARLTPMPASPARSADPFAGPAQNPHHHTPRRPTTLRLLQRCQPAGP